MADNPLVTLLPVGQESRRCKDYIHFMANWAPLHGRVRRLRGGAHGSSGLPVRNSLDGPQRSGEARYVVNLRKKRKAHFIDEYQW